MTATGPGRPHLLAGINLVIFDKDGTLIEFDAMWGGWAVDLASALERATAVPIRQAVYNMLGVDPATGRVEPGGALAATPMARLRERTHDLLVSAGLDGRAAELVLDEAWHAPDPVRLARPLADLAGLFARLRAGGRRVAVATSDDRDPTERTLAALGLTSAIDALVCADDGLPVKPEPDMILYLCSLLAVRPGRTAVVGDSPADLEMGRRAGAGLVVAVLTGAGNAQHLAAHADLVLASVAELEID